MEKNSVMLRVPDVALLLSISPEIVRRYARSGKLKGFRPSGVWLFRVEDVTRFIESKVIPSS